MDIWLKPDNANKSNFLEALKNFGINPLDIEKLRQIDFSKKSMFHVGKASDKIDFLTKVQNVNWESAIGNVRHLTLENLRIPVVGFKDLI